MSGPLTREDLLLINIQPLNLADLQSRVVLSQGPAGQPGPSGGAGITGPPGTTTWSGITDKPSILAFSGLAKITVGSSYPESPSIGDLWVDTN